MHSRNTVLLAIGITLAVQTIFLFVFQNPVLDGHLNGPDSYMRLRRVLHLYEAGNWYDAFDLRTNAPYGELAGGIIFEKDANDADDYNNLIFGVAETKFSAVFGRT